MDSVSYIHVYTCTVKNCDFRGVHFPLQELIFYDLYAYPPVSLFTGLERFLLYATGKKTVSRVQIDFLDDSEAISAHTCSSLVVFPQGNSFSTFDDFCTSFEAVISTSLDFNMV